MKEEIIRILEDQPTRLYMALTLAFLSIVARDNKKSPAKRRGLTKSQNTKSIKAIISDFSH